MTRGYTILDKGRRRLETCVPEHQVRDVAKAAANEHGETVYYCWNDDEDEDLDSMTEVEPDEVASSTAPATYTVWSSDGYELAVNVAEHEIVEMAQEMANDRQESVYYADDSLDIEVSAMDEVTPE